MSVLPGASEKKAQERFSRPWRAAWSMLYGALMARVPELPKVWMVQLGSWWELAERQETEE
jgi:hypothetical protein